MIRRALALVLASLAACRAAPPSASAAANADAAAPAAPWPDLPRTADAAADLIRARTLRPSIAAVELTAERILDAAGKRGWGTLVAGEDDVIAWIQAFLDRAARAGHDAVVLFGSFHDAGGQVDAFRRLIGPGGLRGLTLVAIEQFKATGHWRGIPEEAQRGDDVEIAAYLKGGDPAVFTALAQRHATTDYTAWKFGYEPSVMDLLVTARATGTPFMGCDLPAEAQRLAAAASEEDRLRIREIHCLQAIAARRSAGPLRIAMLWGQAHVQANGIRRFLPPSTEVLAIDLLGFRAGAWTIEAKLAERLVVVDPVLVPMDEASGEAALLYPDAALGGEIDRAISPEPEAEGLHVRVEGTGQIFLGDRSIPVGPEMRAIPRRPEDRAFAIEAGGVRFVGAIGRARAIDLDVDPKRRVIARVEHPAP